MGYSGKNLVERRLCRIDRWLKRCAVACKCGSWSAALAEAECLEAEMKGLREKLWGAVEYEAAGVPKWASARSVFAAVKITVLAVFFALAAVIPVSLDPERDAPSSPLEMSAVALLSSNESDIINALRKSLSSGNVIIPEDIPGITGGEAVKNAAIAAGSTRQLSKNTATGSVNKGQAPVTEADAENEMRNARKPSADEVISLIQAGQRALRPSEPGVTIVSR